MSPISEEDLDRLADYAAGLLDPADAAEVDRLIATQPAWADARLALAAATPRLDQALAGLAGSALPDEVATRLDRALLAEAGRAGAAAEARDRTTAEARDRATAEARDTTAAGTQDRTADGVGDGAAGSGGAGTNVIALTRSRRWTRFAAGGAVAAALVGVIIGGVTLLHPDDGSVSTTSGGSDIGAKAAPARLRIVASGTDYTGGTLPSAAFLAGNPPRANAAGPEPQQLQSPQTGEPTDGLQSPEIPTAPRLALTPDGLDRLTDPAAQASCLSAIQATEGGTPVSLDYAYYQGKPALVVVLTGGRASVVAVGASCGQPGAGPAELSRVGA